MKKFFTTEFQVKASKEDDRTLEFIGSKEIVDRDHDIIKVSGINLKNFKKNPVIQWAHDYASPPVAKATRVWKTKNGELKFKAQFPEMEEYAFADTIYKLLKGGYLSATSVGFIPNIEKMEFIDDEKKKERRIYHEIELLEISVVPVPANQEALIVSRGIKKALKDEVIDEMELNDMLSHIEQPEEEKGCCGEENIDPEDFLMNEFISEKDVEMKPYANEHACRLQDPKKYDRFARKNCSQKHDGKCIDVIFGIKDNKSETQALRYPTKNWSTEDAKSHCKSREGKFEAAAKEVEENEQISIEESVSKEEFDALVEKLTHLEELFNKAFEPEEGDNDISPEEDFWDRFLQDEQVEEPNVQPDEVDDSIDYLFEDNSTQE